MTRPARSSIFTATNSRSTASDECHTREHGAPRDFDEDEDSKDEHPKGVKCEGENTGPVTELKVGTDVNSMCHR